MPRTTSVFLVTVQELQHIYTTLEICFLQHTLIFIQITFVPLTIGFEINVQATPIILVLHILSNIFTRDLQVKISGQDRKRPYEHNPADYKPFYVQVFHIYTRELG
jgi:hypothetical protein